MNLSNFRDVGRADPTLGAFGGQRRGRGNGEDNISLPENDLPVPVLAEPREIVPSQLGREQARESTTSPKGKTPQPKGEQDSRGEQFISPTDRGLLLLSLPI